jgi:hypothetical protein
MAEKIKLQFGTHTMVREIEHAYLNARYEEGKPFNFNRDNGGYTYHITAIAVDTAEYIAVYMEIDSKSFKSCAEFISDDEHRASLEQRKKLLPKHENVELPDFGLGNDDE